MKFKTVINDGAGCVSILMSDESLDSVLDGFIDIYVDDRVTPSPIGDLKDAEHFANIIIKLLEIVTNGSEVDDIE